MLRFNTSSNGFEGYNGSAWTGIGGGNPWEFKNSNYTASAGDRLFVNTSGNAVTITLPASPSAGDQVTFIDLDGTFDSNALTVARNGEAIMALGQDMTVNGNNNAFTLVFSNGTNGWKFLNLA